MAKRVNISHYGYLSLSKTPKKVFNFKTEQNADLDD